MAKRKITPRPYQPVQVGTRIEGSGKTIATPTPSLRSVNVQSQPRVYGSDKTAFVRDGALADALNALNPSRIVNQQVAERTFNYRNGFNNIQPWQVDTGLQDLLGEKDISDDRLQQLQDQRLQYLMSLEQRAYNKEQQIDQRQYDAALLADARAYDSPAAQIARLMQTGMSRDAALQFLSGSGSGSGSGTSSTQLAAPATAYVPGTTPSQTALTEQQQKLIDAQTTSQRVGTLFQVASGIMSAAQQFQSLSMLQDNAAILRYQAQDSKMQQSALLDVGDMVGLVESLRLSGDLKEDDFKSVGHLTSALNRMSVSADYPAVSAFMSSGYLRLANNPYGFKLLNDTFNNRWSTHGLKATDEVVDLALRKAQSETLYAEINNDKLVEEISNINAATLKALSDIDVNNANIEQTNAQTNLIGEQITTEGHKRRLIDAQTAEANARKMLTDAQINLSEAEFEQVKPYLIDLQQHPERYSAIATMGGISEYERLYFQTRGDQFHAREELARVALEDKTLQAQFDYAAMIAKRQAQVQNPNLVKFNAWLDLWSQGAGQGAGAAAGAIGTAIKFIPK